MTTMSQVCVGYQDGVTDHRMWFTRWFLDQCYYEAPAVIWQRDGNIITRTYKPDYVRPSWAPNIDPAIWVLTRPARHPRATPRRLARLKERLRMFIVDFDYRSDNGPRLVGPFDTREHAQLWTDGLRGPGWEAEFCIAPLAAP
jgi:hypothetical protein